MKSNHPSKRVSLPKKLFGSFRNRVQLVVFILTLAIGFQFYLFVFQAGGKNPISVPRPEGVEAFLPIGALMGWKYYITTGIWDDIHPAAMVFVLFAVFISFLLRKGFCSWFCPVGTLSEWLWKAGEVSVGRTYRLPKWIDLPLRSVKYLLMLFFVYMILIMSSAEIAAFLKSPYYKIADVKMLYFFTKMSLLTAMVLGGIAALSLVFRNFWCRYACPYGALLGLVSVFSPTRIHRNRDRCTNCGKCHQVCPFHLPVDKQVQIKTPACTNCMDCVDECPAPDTLQLKITGTNTAIPAQKVGVLIIVFLGAMIYLATITGHWKSRLTENEFRMWLIRTQSSVTANPSGSSVTD